MLTEFSALATTFLVATILIPFGVAVLLYGFFSKRKKLAWFGFTSIALAVPVLIIVIFIGAIRGLNTAVNVASNTGGDLIQDLRKRMPAENTSDDVDDDEPKTDSPVAKNKTGDTPTGDAPADNSSTSFELRLKSFYDRMVKGESTSVIVAREFADKGVRFGTVETRAPAKGKAFTISVYMIFDKPYAETIRMRALDADGREMGRVNIAVNEKKGAARYVDFEFDARLNPAKLRFGVLDAPGFRDPFPRR